MLKVPIKRGWIKILPYIMVFMAVLDGATDSTRAAMESPGMTYCGIVASITVPL